jgi:hypothetical protein
MSAEAGIVTPPERTHLVGDSASTACWRRPDECHSLPPTGSYRVAETRIHPDPDFGPRFWPASDHDGADIVRQERTIVSDHRQTFEARLGDEHPIEWIGVVRRQ